MSNVNDIIDIICDVLVLTDRKDEFDESTPLLGALPEFDSVAVVTLITAVEDEFGVAFDDDEISADVFETVGSFASLVEQKLA